MITASIAVIGKTNKPVYVKTFGDNPDYFKSVIACSIDVLSEQRSTDMYRGFLCPMDEWQMYGYATTTRVKFVAVLSDRHRLQDMQLRDFFLKLHAAYVDYVMNCLAPLDADIVSSRFDAALTKHVNAILEKPPPPEPTSG